MKFLKAFGVLLLCLVGFDVIGILMCLFFEIILTRSRSALAFYTVWFVLGIFCGLAYFMTGGDILAGESKGAKGHWTDRPDAGRIGLMLMLIAAALLTALSFFFHQLFWRLSMAPSFYVPDNEGTSLTFFITILASTIFFSRTMRPEPKKRR